MRHAVLPAAVLLTLAACSGDQAGEGDPRMQGSSGILYGDDDSLFARNGSCEDPRFAGASNASMLAMGHDASDCRSRGTRRGVGRRGPAYRDEFRTPASADEIFYGDNSGPGALDGECRDMRFKDFSVMAVGMFDIEEVAADATDCRAAFENGDAVWIGDPVAAKANGTGVMTEEMAERRDREFSDSIFEGTDIDIQAIRNAE